MRRDLLPVHAQERTAVRRRFPDTAFSLALIDFAVEPIENFRKDVDTLIQSTATRPDQYEHV